MTYRSAELLGQFRPITIAGLLTFLALTVPLVWVLARRLDASADDRERLLLAAVEASDAERRRIARDLHDGVVQDLAGTSFALSATARDLADRPETASRLEALGIGVRHSLRSLRSLLVEIYPPDLRTEGLGAALDDLVAPAIGGRHRASMLARRRHHRGPRRGRRAGVAHGAGDRAQRGAARPPRAGSPSS